MVTKLKNSNCDKFSKKKFQHNSETQIFTKLQNSNFYKTLKIKLLPNCDKTKKSNYDKTEEKYCDKT